MKLLGVNKAAASWLLLALCLAGTIGLSIKVKRSLDKEAVRDFSLACDQLMLKVQDRLTAHALVLLNGAALSTAGPMSDDEWREYAYSLRMASGLVSQHVFGYQPADLARTDTDILLAALSVSPARLPLHLEPASALFLRDAMRRASDTGRVALSGPVSLQLGPGNAKGFGVYMYAPVYHKGWPRRTLVERQAALMGWVYSAYPLHDLMEGILHDLTSKRHPHHENIAVRVKDAQLPESDSLIFTNQPGTDPEPSSMFAQERVVEFNGKTWVLGFDLLPGTSMVRYTEAWSTLAAGLFLSALLFALVHSLLRTRAYSMRLAKRLTRELQSRETQLRASEENLRSTLDTLPYLLFELELSGRILACHGPAAEIEALGTKNLIGRQVQDIMPAAAAETALSALREALTTGQSHGQKLALKLGGERRWFELSVNRKPIEAGRAARFIVLSRDVTERERSKADLVNAIDLAERANHAKSRFLAAASHDLRQPLSALGLYMGVLRSRAAPEQQAIVQSIDDCVASLAELLTDLLDVSKLDAGVVTPQVSSFSLHELLETLVSVHGAKAQVKGLRLRLRRHDLVIRTDRALLHRMLGNLISNAIRYTTSGGVLVATRCREGRHWVEVWDTGIGIAADKTNLIFEEFRQLDDGARNRGSGLGLAIVAKCAALLGLQVRVASRPGRGSVFSIELPPKSSEPIASPNAALPLSNRSLRIAIVDDNAQVLESLTMSLQSAGHEIIAARDGRHLLQQLGANAPDILLTDYRLTQQQTGFDVINTVRTVFGEDLPAMVMTGDTDPALIRAMAEQGIAVQFKPLQLETLLPLLYQITPRRDT